MFTRTRADSKQTSEVTESHRGRKQLTGRGEVSPEWLTPLLTAETRGVCPQFTIYQ